MLFSLYSLHVYSYGKKSSYVIELGEIIQIDYDRALLTQ